MIEMCKSTTSADSDIEPLHITLGLGLTGYFMLTSNIPSQKGLILSFCASNLCLSLISETPETIYFSNNGFDLRRSPDPLYEQEEFM